MDILEKIDAAIARIKSGHASMRVPAEETDPDLVLYECHQLLSAGRIDVVIAPLANAPSTEETLHPVWKATTRFGHSCHFGTPGMARAWGGRGAKIEKIDLKPIHELTAVPAAAQPTAPVAAKTLAEHDAMLYGTGFYRSHPNGVTEHIPTEQVTALTAPAQSEAKAVVTIHAADEYGPILNWHSHWVNHIGAKLYTAPPVDAPADPLVGMLQQVTEDFQALLSYATGDRLTSPGWSMATIKSAIDENVNALIAANVDAPAGVGETWQRIESAPRDGTNIILRFGKDCVSQGKYVSGGLPHPWKFIDTNDGITWLINHAVDGMGGPSHWMPMPSNAPKACGAFECKAGQVDGLICPDESCDIEDGVRVPIAPPVAAAADKTWRHAANEWADAATSGLVWITGIGKGDCTVEAAVENMKALIAHARESQPVAAAAEDVAKQDAALTRLQLDIQGWLDADQRPHANHMRSWIADIDAARSKQP